jgi:hypothetical protein
MLRHHLCLKLYVPKLNVPVGKCDPVRFDLDCVRKVIKMRLKLKFGISTIEKLPVFNLILMTFRKQS